MKGVCFPYTNALIAYRSLWFDTGIENDNKKSQIEEMKVEVEKFTEIIEIFKE
jgi:hypothetical protein